MSIDRLTKVFREVFENDCITLTPELGAKDVTNWDSFNHINLIIALEGEFSISFTTDQIAGMQNVGELVKILNNNGQNILWPS